MNRDVLHDRVGSALRQKKRPNQDCTLLPLTPSAGRCDPNVCTGVEESLSKRWARNKGPFCMTLAIALLEHLRHRRIPPSVPEPH